MSMYPVYYYECYRARLVENDLGAMHTPYEPPIEEESIHEQIQYDLASRKERALSVAADAGIDLRNVIVEAYSSVLPPDSVYMRLANAREPAVIVMDSLSMFLQQSGMTYWITLLRTSLQNGLLPITVDEYANGVHLEYEAAVYSRRVAIESLTSHIRPEPKRTRGRRKHGPTAEILEIILLESERRTVHSSADVLQRITRWYDDSLEHSPEKFLRHRVFSGDRWMTYKYKIRKMARELLEETWKNTYTFMPIEGDIWQSCFLIDGGLVYPSCFAAREILPDFGYELIANQWRKK